jgi:hypothetical protein
MVGDLVLRLKQDGHRKLGPYIVAEVIPRGAYRLHDKKTGKDKRNHGMLSSFEISMRKYLVREIKLLSQ